MDAHLDWHFRQNRRMKDKAKKSYSRSWLVGEEVNKRDKKTPPGEPEKLSIENGFSRVVI